MTHGDDNGLVLPPAVAPIQAVVIPVAAHKPGVTEKANEVYERLKKVVRTKIDLSDNSPGWKFSEYEMKGVPLRVELGPRDIEKDQCVIARRDTGEKLNVPLAELEATVERLLKEVTAELYRRAKQNREEKTYSATTLDEFVKTAKEKPGMIKAMWCRG